MYKYIDLFLEYMPKKCFEIIMDTKMFYNGDIFNITKLISGEYG